MKQGWVKKKLVDACDLFTDGNWIESKDQSLEGIRLIQTGNVGSGEYKDKKGKERFVSQETFDRLKCTEIFPGDILVSRLPEPVGRSCIIPDTDSRLITAVDCTIVRTSEELLPVFLRYFQLSNAYLKDVNSKVTGTTRSRISRKNLGLIEIPIPPLEEQKQIVAKLDQCFEVIDKAKANVAKNLEDAKELFQSKLNDTFSQKGEGWVEKKLGDVCSLIGGGTPSKKNKQFYTGDILWATVRDMKLDVITQTECSITKEAVSKSSTNIIPKGNVIIATRVGLGKVCLINQDTAINQDLRGVIPKEKSDLQVKYLFWWFKSISKLIINEGTGATVQGVKLPFVKSLNIPIPTTASQSNIVALLDTLQEQTQSLESKYQQELNSLEELKKSILQKAFEGEL